MASQLMYDGDSETISVPHWQIDSEREDEPIPRSKREGYPKSGTKYLWMLNNDTYRLSIQTPDGVIQVKSVIDGTGEVDTQGKRMWDGRYPLMQIVFENYSDWLHSLPKGGKTKIISPDPRVGPQNVGISATLKDIEKVQALECKFNLRSFAYGIESAQCKKEQIYDYMRRLSYEYIEKAYAASPTKLKDLEDCLSGVRRAYRMHVEKMATMTKEERESKDYYYRRRGSAKLMVRCADIYYNITCKVYNADCGYIYRDDGKRFKTFEDMGADRWATGETVLMMRNKGDWIAV